MNHKPTTMLRQITLLACLLFLYGLTNPVSAQQSTPPLQYAAFFGGSGWESADAVAVGPDGSVYLAGRTPSKDFPRSPGVIQSKGGQLDLFVVKLSPAGDAIEWSAVIGGASLDSASALAVDDERVYVAGDTWSADFPGGAAVSGENDAFVLALNTTDGSLSYSRLLGGADQDQALALAVENGSVLVAGMTWSSSFPAAGYRGSADGFAARLNPDGSTAYAVLLGGGGLDSILAAALQDGQAYLAGSTYSADFPTPGSSNGDAIFVHLSDAGQVLQAVRLGGSGEDGARAIALTGDGSAAIAGFTASADFPLAQGNYKGERDGFIAVVSTTGEFRSAAWVGSPGLDEINSLAYHPEGGYFLVGSTDSKDFPVTSNAFQKESASVIDGIILQIDPNSLSETLYSSYLGGEGEDNLRAAALNQQGELWVVGYTKSSQIPTTENALDRELNGSQDAYIVQLQLFEVDSGETTPTQPAASNPPSTEAAGTESSNPQPTAAGTTPNSASNPGTPTTSALQNTPQATEKPPEKTVVVLASQGIETLQPSTQPITPQEPKPEPLSAILIGLIALIGVALGGLGWVVLKKRN